MKRKSALIQEHQREVGSGDTQMEGKYKVPLHLFCDY